MEAVAVTRIYVYIFRGVPKTIEAAAGDSWNRRRTACETDDLVDALKATGP